MQHRVSILMPCFNASGYLKDALESILNQSYQNLVVFLLDDGSSDNSLKIAQQIAQFDDRVQIHTNSTNLGIIESRNKLLDMCDSEYAAWMDADDIAQPERIKKQLEFMLWNPSYIACTCNYIRKGFGEEEIIEIPSKNVTSEYLLFRNYVFNPGSFFHVPRCMQNKVRFRNWLSGASDYLFWVELSKYGKIGILKETLMIYRLHSQQETVAQKQRQLAGCLEVVQYQLKNFGCNVDIQDISRLLVYPAEVLDQEFTLLRLKNSAKIIRQIRRAFPLIGYDDEVIDTLLLDMFRSQSRRVGVIGVMYFISLFGLRGLKHSRYWGLNLFWSAIKTDCSRLLQVSPET